MKKIETKKSRAFMLKLRTVEINVNTVYQRMSLEEAMKLITKKYEPWHSGVMLSFGDDRFLDFGKVTTEEGTVWLDTREEDSDRGCTFYVVASLQKNGEEEEHEIARLFWKEVGNNSWLLNPIQ